jgi:hypothetical protein
VVLVSNFHLSFFFVFAKTLEIVIIEHLIKFWKKLLLESKLQTFTIL